MDDFERKARAKRDEFAAQRATIAAEAELLKMRLSSLESQINLLDELLTVPAAALPVAKVLPRLQPQVIARAANVGPGLPATGKPGPSAAVVSLLQAHPEGMSQKDIVIQLVGKIATDSENQGAIIRNTLLNLVQRKRIQRDEGTGMITLLG